ncbi:hypothetical protein WJX73_008930, partial [Symbiochloris irregularis]
RVLGPGPSSGMSHRSRTSTQDHGAGSSDDSDDEALQQALRDKYGDGPQRGAGVHGSEPAPGLPTNASAPDGGLRPSTPPDAPGTPSWTCSACTYVNRGQQASFLQCAVCNAKKHGTAAAEEPSPTRPPAPRSNDSAAARPPTGRLPPTGLSARTVPPPGPAGPGGGRYGEDFAAPLAANGRQQPAEREPPTSPFAPGPGAPLPFGSASGSQDSSITAVPSITNTAVPDRASRPNSFGEASPSGRTTPPMPAAAAAAAPTPAVRPRYARKAPPIAERPPSPRSTAVSDADFDSEAVSSTAGVVGVAQRMGGMGFEDQAPHSAAARRVAQSSSSDSDADDESPAAAQQPWRSPVQEAQSVSVRPPVPQLAPIVPEMPVSASPVGNRGTSYESRAVLPDDRPPGPALVRQSTNTGQLPDYFKLPQDRQGWVDTGTAVGPSLDEELFPALRPPVSEDDLSDVEAINRELRMVAALEASVYLARSGKGGGKRVKAKAVHAPARRLARTTISLGPEEGITFGLRAIRAIQAAADGSTDVVGMAFWWSNCIQLRWMLWAMCHGGGADEYEDEQDLGDGSENGGEEFDWVMKVLVPPLRHLESYIFNQMFSYLWRVMTDFAASEAAGVPAGRPLLHPPSREEAAVHRWLDALMLVRSTIMPAATTVTSGHLALLKNKILTALMRRLDSSMFEKLMEDAGGKRKNSFSPAWKGAAPIAAATRMDGDEVDADDSDMDSRLLPYVSGTMCFSTGMALKLAVSKWSNWSADVGIRDERRTDAGWLLFPRLRATADLLMMDKEKLTDRKLRLVVVPGLSLHTICHLLSCFRPDDLACDPLAPGLLQALQTEVDNEDPNDPASADEIMAPIYEPPSEASLLQEGLIEPVSLEMDAESEDEVQALSEMYDQENGGEGTHRFELLRQLWASPP